jgi:hypothetical protein
LEAAKVEARMFDGDHEREGIIGSFYSRMHVGYALGVFGPKTLRDLDAIRSIRNAFAHSHHDLSFETEAIKDLCQFHVWQENRDNSFLAGKGGHPSENARSKFLIEAYLLALFLLTSDSDRGRPKTYYGSDSTMPPSMFA